MLFTERKISPPAEGQEPAAPRHIAIIMDGNGRWAKKRWLPKIAGHRRGAEAVRIAVKACVEFKISYLTLYTFSSENWNRPADEVRDLMGLLRHYLRSELEELDERGVRVRLIGDRAGLASDIIDLMEEAEAKTKGNSGLNLVLAINYGGHAEIVTATRQIAQKVKDGSLDPADINEGLFAQHLHTADIPDPDLIIRTSGEKRLSNFLLWQSAYAELVFIDDLWPDFDKETLRRAISEYHTRDRRFGVTSG
jgi:undecaprenyl diphosphate synthase